MTSARAWWIALSTREKRLILVMLALVALVVLWLGIIRPVTDGLANARADHLVAIERQATVAAGVEALQAARGGGPRPLGAPVEQVVAQSAAEAGFTLDTNSAAGPGTTQIRINSARAPALFAWLGGLEQRGVVVDALTVQPGANGTVSAQATLRDATA